MTVRELYAFLEEKIPRELSCDWDNDGLMCCGDDSRPVRRALVALDITAAVVDRAVKEGYDLILSHHPLIFRPLKALNRRDTVASKVITLLQNGVCAMSFHTRLDAVTGGVNDVLAKKLGLCDVTPFGENDETIGRIGTLPTPMAAEAFAKLVKQATGAEYVLLSDAGLPVSRVALLGGGGAGDLPAARAAGADTYLTGELKHDQLTDAPEKGMNLIMGGHFYTENPVCEHLADLIKKADPTVEVTVMNSNTARFI